MAELRETLFPIGRGFWARCAAHIACLNARRCRNGARAADGPILAKLATGNKGSRNQKIAHGLYYPPFRRPLWVDSRPSLLPQPHSARLEFVNSDPLQEPSIGPGFAPHTELWSFAYCAIGLGFCIRVRDGTHSSVVNTGSQELKCQETIQKKTKGK
jgi:hypothetical protein